MLQDYSPHAKALGNYASLLGTVAIISLSNKNTVRGIIIIKCGHASIHDIGDQSKLTCYWGGLDHFSGVFAYFETFQSGQNTGATFHSGVLIRGT